MKKKYLKFGFTLVEVMIACALLATIATVTFCILKSSLDSTLKQKAQQNANENAKTIMSTITTDLQSSSVIKGNLQLFGTNGALGGQYKRDFYQYPSSVIYPPTSRRSSGWNAYSMDADSLAEAHNRLPGLLEIGNDNFASRVEHNKNRLIFYNQRGKNSDEWEIIEYIGQLEPTNRLATLVRKTYAWGPHSGAWAGINAGVGSHRMLVDGVMTYFYGSSPLSHDGVMIHVGTNGTSNDNIAFAPDATHNVGQITDSTTICELPNRGDIFLLYTARTLDERYSAFSEENRTLSANQYTIKVIVFETITPKDIPATYLTNATTPNMTIEPAFFRLFTREHDRLNRTERDIRDNYRFCELNTTVSVRSSDVY